ncbi:MAG: hypothetical protein JST59_01905 [Actinobacteria bacterium]|nr:hypothetical protein [Actinomycetota bacterium]
MSAIVASLIIAFSIFSDAFLCLILVFAGRAVIYIITRKRFLRDFLAFEYMKGLTALFEIVTLCLINSRSTTAVIVFALATVSLQVSHEILIVFLTSRKARLDKLKKEPDTEGSSTADGSNFMIIYSDLGGVEIPTQQIQDVSTHKEIS